MLFRLREFTFSQCFNCLRLRHNSLGFITLIFGIGQSLGPAVAGWIKDSTGSFAWAFILSAVVSLMGAAGSMLLRKKT